MIRKLIRWLTSPPDIDKLVARVRAKGGVNCLNEYATLGYYYDRGSIEAAHTRAAAQEKEKSGT